jgi:hypothetical protein
MVHMNLRGHKIAWRLMTSSHSHSIPVLTLNSTRMACEKNNHLVQTADNGSVIGRIHKMSKTSSVTQAFTGKGGGENKILHQ